MSTYTITGLYYLGSARPTKSLPTTTPYTVNYTTDWTGITNHINTAESYTPGCITGRQLYAPFAGLPVYLPVVSWLSSITVNGVGLTERVDRFEAVLPPPRPKPGRLTAAGLLLS